MMRNKVILAGGTGLIGRALAQHMVTLGWEVVILTRERQPPPAINQLAASSPRLVYWDGAEVGPWAAELAGAAALVNLVGRSIDCVFTPKNKQAILESRLQAVATLGRAIAQCPQPPAVWVQASAVGFYGIEGAAPCTETAPGGTDFLAEVCRQWEAALPAACPAATRLVIFRLGVVLDPHGGAYPTLARLTRFYLGGAAGSGRQGFSWIHYHDVRQAFQQAILQPALRGVYNLCAPQACTNANFMAGLRRSLHRPWAPAAPALLVKLAATYLMNTDSSLILGGRACSPRRLLDQGFSFEFPELAGALGDLAR
jgi:hypothetical protein